MPINNHIQKFLKYKFYILGILILAGIGYFALTYRPKSQVAPASIDKATNEETLSSGETLAEAIRRVESQQPSRIGKSPTTEEIYNNAYVKHIRTALNGYLDGTNTGVEEAALGEIGEGGNLDCGLNNFDKSYYGSKFIVLKATDNDYGGVQAYIVFIDKPDTIFWAWVYGLRGGEEYVLRGFCKRGPREEIKKDFPATIKGIIDDSKFSL